MPFTQGHHIHHWANGGPTTLSNLTLLCRRHHRSVHEDGFRVERLPDGELQFWRPNGRPLPDAPSLPPVSADAMDVLQAQNDAVGRELNAKTLSRGWAGEGVNVGYAIDVLHPLALRASVRV